MTLLLALFLQISATQKQQVFSAANKLMPGVTWKQSSVVLTDFTCRGRTEYAILGTVNSEAVGRTYMIVGVFLDGLNKQPAVLQDIVRNAASARLTVESLDYDREDQFGNTVQGFERSTTCKGLNLEDDEIDSLHIYWNRYLHDFVSWSL